MSVYASVLAMVLVFSVGVDAGVGDGANVGADVVGVISAGVPGLLSAQIAMADCSLAQHDVVVAGDVGIV